MQTAYLTGLARPNTVVSTLIITTVLAWVLVLSIHWTSHAGGEFTDEVALWVLMTIGMMAPSAIPMVKTFHRLSTDLDPSSKQPTPTIVFAVAYLIVWGGYAVVAAFLQETMRTLMIIDDQMKFAVPAISGIFLICAGLFQWSGAKHACLSKCRSPLGFLIGYYEPGLAGAFQVGVRHALFCIGCCWLLMLLVWSGGMMNLVWMALLTTLVVAEKTMPKGLWVARVAGIAFTVLGFAQISLGADDTAYYFDLMSSICGWSA